MSEIPEKTIVDVLQMMTREMCQVKDALQQLEDKHEKQNLFIDFTENLLCKLDDIKSIRRYSDRITFVMKEDKVIQEYFSLNERDFHFDLIKRGIFSHSERAELYKGILENER